MLHDGQSPREEDCICITCRVLRSVFTARIYASRTVDIKKTVSPSIYTESGPG